MSKSSKKETARKPEPAPKGKPSLGLIVLVFILGGIAVFALTRNKQYEPPADHQTTPPAQAQAQENNSQPQYSTPSAPEQTPDQSTAHVDSHVPAFFENPDSAEPLNRILAPASVPYFARNGYEIAERKPKLMTQLPCFCYCDKFGHTSLHTCFETDHAISCDICLKEAIDADRMDSEGMSPQEIREVIIQQYQSRGHNHS